MGSALGGGAADQVGAGSAAQLTKLTVWGILGFFILSLSLYALYQYEAGERTALIRAGPPKLRPTPIHLRQAILQTPPNLSDAPETPAPAPEDSPATPVEADNEEPQSIRGQESQAPSELVPPAQEANSSQ